MALYYAIRRSAIKSVKTIMKSRNQYFADKDYTDLANEVSLIMLDQYKNKNFFAKKNLWNVVYLYCKQVCSKPRCEKLFTEWCVNNGIDIFSLSDEEREKYKIEFQNYKNKK